MVLKVGGRLPAPNESAGPVLVTPLAEELKALEGDHAKVATLLRKQSAVGSFPTVSTLGQDAPEASGLPQLKGN